MPKRGGGETAKLLEDPDVARWHAKLRQGSEATADVWLRRLRAFSLRVGKAPAELVPMAPKELRDLFADFVSSEQRRGSSGPYIKHTVAVVRSWLRWNGVEVVARIKIRDSERTHEETALSREQLRALLNAASPRERVAVCLMAQSGCRPEVLGNYDGSDGLRVGDLSELRIEGATVRFEKVPTVVRVRRELSKGGHQYLTFLGEEGCHVLGDYMESRLRRGETLTPASSIICPEYADKPFIRSLNVGNSIRMALTVAGFRQRTDGGDNLARSKRAPRRTTGMRPYVLRTTFASRLTECENLGRVPHSYWNFWLGHQGEMSAKYSTNRGLLAPTLVDSMRSAYAKCDAALSSTSTEGERLELRNEFKQLLKAVAKGLSPAEAERLAAASPDELREFTGRKASEEPPPSTVPVSGAPGDRSVDRLVSVEEAGRLLQLGWSVVTNAGSLLVVRGPVSR